MPSPFSTLRWLLLLLVAPSVAAQETSVRPGINDSFRNPDVAEFVGRFEVESREVYLRRREIVAACRVQPGSTVADIGAGTGLFTRLLAEAVGKQGRVIAVDIAPKFLEHIAAQAREAGQQNVDPLLAKDDSTNLQPASIDLAFVCDTYHHFEFPSKILASLHRALKPEGRLVLIDFRRIAGKSSDFVMGHVRAGQEVFEQEILRAGFRKDREELDLLQENYFVMFSKTAVNNPDEFKISLSFSRAHDRGDNPGTLFEIRDSDGTSIAGAGYLGAYNTSPRSDREELHVFVRSMADSPWQIARLPRIDSAATGYYPFQLDGEIYASARNGSDPRVFRWNRETSAWQVEAEVPNAAERIGGKVLNVAPGHMAYDGRELLRPDQSQRFGEHYFAGGRLVLRSYRPAEAGSEAINAFQVYLWNPAQDASPQRQPQWDLSLPQPREFVYAFGQWRDEILAVTNMGGVYRLRPSGWDTMRTPVATVSYQVYCAINYYDELLLGHYPTGEILAYAGGELVLQKKWPPVMSGASTSAREAQTLAIYGGQLYCGVWPWAEVWRYDGAAWQFVQRMFTHPAVTDSVTHPYEAQTRQVDQVYNLWGQRVTGLIPSRGSLFIATSSKGGAPWDPKFGFLSPDQRQDYGAIYQATHPGQTSFHLPPAATPVCLTATVRGAALQIMVDDRLMAELPLSVDVRRRLPQSTTTIGRGLYGPGTLELKDVRLPAPGTPR